MSLFLSFLSVLQTLIQFNEWSKRRHTLHRMVLVVPFFAVTILYRVLALALILAFAGGKFGLLPVFGLLLTQVCYHFTLEPNPFLIYVGFIPFFVFRFLVTLTKRRKNQVSFSGKMQIFYTENKLIFSFLVPLTKKRKMK